MFAVVNIAGHQFKVMEGDELVVNNLNAEEGAKVTFDEVLLVDSGGKTTVGKPTIKSASVSAEILANLKGDTVTVFKKKRRKGYQKKNGHRQHLSKIKISSIKA